MIAFDLKCGNGHAFEGWFDSARAFEEQRDQGLVACPICGDEEITKLLSPINTLTGRSAELPAPVNPETPDPEQMAQAKMFMKAVQEAVENNFDDVGADFAKEALKIHYGVEPARNIRGSSTEAEEEELKREGVEFMKLPVPKFPD